MTDGPLILLHQAQVDFLACEEPFAAFVGGIGSGKSFILCYDLLRRVKPGRLYMVIAPTYPMLRDATLRTFADLTRRLGIAVEWVRSESRVRLRRSGAEILFRSADNPETLRGPNLSGIAMDEASLFERDVYDVAIGRLRQGREMGWLRAVFTPKGLNHWSYDVFNTGKPDTALIRAKTVDNPFLPAGFVDKLVGQYGEHSRTARQELGGEFLSAEGADWPADYFDWDGFRFSDWPAELPLRVAFYDPAGVNTSKPGDYHALTLVGIDRDGHVWADAELWRGPDAPAAESVARVDRRCRRFEAEAVGVETNFSEYLIPLFEASLALENARRSGTRMLPPLPLKGVRNTLKKHERVRRELDPRLERRQVHVKRTVGGDLLAAQIRDFPTAEHDDGPDSLAGCLKLAGFLLR